jgi:hypothetical protein
VRTLLAGRNKFAEVCETELQTRRWERAVLLGRVKKSPAPCSLS